MGTCLHVPPKEAQSGICFTRRPPIPGSAEANTKVCVDETLSSVSALRVYWKSRVFLISAWTPFEDWTFRGVETPPPPSICPVQSSLSGDTGGSHLQRNDRSKRVVVRERYSGAHRTSHGLIRKSCYRLVYYFFGFYWSEHFESNLELLPEFQNGQVCVRGVDGVQHQRPY